MDENEKELVRTIVEMTKQEFDNRFYEQQKRIIELEDRLNKLEEAILWTVHDFKR